MDNSYYPGNNYNPGGFPSGKMKYPHYIDPTAWDAQKRKIRMLGLASGLSILGYIVIGTFLSNLIAYLSRTAAVNFFPSADTLGFIMEIVYSIIAVGVPFLVMRLVMGKKYYDNPIPYSKPVNGKYFIPLVVMGLGVCFIGDIFTSIIAMASDSVYQASQYASAAITATPDNALDMLLYVLRTAIVPALIEESVMRGVIMQPLRKYGDMFAILMSSLVFGLLHCNLAQIPFAFIAGIALGYVVCITESLWTAILLHALNNTYSLVVSLGYSRYGQENSAVMYISSLVFYGVILAAAIVAYKYFTSDKTPRLRKSLAVNSGRNFIPAYAPGSEKVSNGNLVSAYLLNPGMIAAFAAVCIETVSMMSR